MHSLNDICYEQIKDNFWYGIFGDFKLIIDKETGFFNATKLCDMGGKRFRKWKESKTSKNLIQYYTHTFGHPQKGSQTCHYLKPSEGTNKIDLIISGTYVRKELFLALSIWISHNFYGKCYKIIEDYYIQDFKNYKEDVGKLEEQVKIIEQINIDLQNSFSKLEIRFSNIEKMASPYTESDLDPCLAIYRTNDEIRPYYAIRVQKRQLSKSVEKLKRCYTIVEEVYKKERDPNSIKLFILICKEPFIFNRRGNMFNTCLEPDDLKEVLDCLYDEYFNSTE